MIGTDGGRPVLVSGASQWGVLWWALRVLFCASHCIVDSPTDLPSGHLHGIWEGRRFPSCNIPIGRVKGLYASPHDTPCAVLQYARLALVGCQAFRLPQVVCAFGSTLLTWGHGCERRASARHHTSGWAYEE